MCTHMSLVMDDIQSSGITFIRNFDSANLARVEPVPYDVTVWTNSANNHSSSTSTRALPDIPDYEFNVWTTPDCGGTEFENGNRTWFFFGMRANASSVLIKLNIVDLNKQAKMYSQGMCPVFKVVPSRYGWDRIRDKPTYTNEDEIFTLSFKYRTPENPQAITYFAFTYPFSYSDIQKMLGNIDTKFFHAPFSENDDIYYVRECLCHSIENRRVDLLTISSKRGISNIREARLKNLFPEEEVHRPFRFPDKKVIFISARVHPGETPSSFVFNGLLHLLLNRDDTVAITLRRMYVFKLIPCLNPDGVARGHYRTDARGVNLNRMYLNPSLNHHPPIYAARSLIRYYHYGVEKSDSSTLCSNCINDKSPVESAIATAAEDQQSGNLISSKVSNMSLDEKQSGSICLKLKQLCTICGSPMKNPSSCENIEKMTCKGDDNPNSSGLFLYMDLHGHASKKGIFMYGNHFDTMEQNVECMLLAKLMSINNHNFHFTACNFSERNMFIKDKRDGMSRAGSGRVAISTMTGLIKSYTLECNYNTGRIVNVLPPTVKERQQKGYALPMPPKYSPTVFEEVGRSIGASILDLTGNNPQTRLPHSEFHSLNGVMDWIRNNCIQDMTESTQSNNIKTKTKTSISQGVKRRLRVRSSSGIHCNKPISQPRPSSVPVERKENVIFDNENVTILQNSTKVSKKKSTMKIHKTMLKKNKSKISLSLKCNKDSNEDKGRAIKNKPVKVTGKKMNLTNKLRSINENQKAIEMKCANPKLEMETNKKIFAEKTLFPWTVTNSNTLNEASYSTSNEKSVNFINNMLSEPGSSSQQGFRVNTFSKSFGKSNKKHSIRRIGGAGESLARVEKLKKKKRLVKKL